MATRARTKNTYDEVKEFQGQRYTGMKVGRRHKWRYDAGEWTEQKITPDKWDFRYAVVKRRAGRAPEGSGAPVGTAYRWYILADQVVTKLDANSYMTEMAGLKYKVAHRRADKGSWNASERAQRKRLATLLREMADELEQQPAEPTEKAHATSPRGRAKVKAHAPRTRTTRAAPQRRASARKPRTRRSPSPRR
jgi:hypothetical protein